MRFLIDTHVFLWFISDAKELSKTAEKIMEDGNTKASLTAEIFSFVKAKTSETVEMVFIGETPLAANNLLRSLKGKIPII